MRCQGVLGALLDIGVNAGTVQFDADGRPADETHLTRDVCRGLRRFLDDPRSRRLDCVRAGRVPREAFATVRAVHTLAHEAVHLAGVRNEAEARCYGLQPSTSLPCGSAPISGRPARSRPRSRASIRRSRRTTGPTSADGGPLDLVPGSATFPLGTVVGMSEISPPAIFWRAASTASVAAGGTSGPVLPRPTPSSARP